MGGLPRLQRCYLSPRPSHTMGPVDILPMGPWLHSLRWLAATINCLVNSVAMLQQAPVLELVEACETDNRHVDWRSAAADAFFEWLAKHPSLQRVSFDDGGVDHPSLFDSRIFAAKLVQLGRRRPGLLVHVADHACGYDCLLDYM